MTPLLLFFIVLAECVLRIRSSAVSYQTINNHAHGREILGLGGIYLPSPACVTRCQDDDGNCRGTGNRCPGTQPAGLVT